jgi:hypothetical protein
MSHFQSLYLLFLTLQERYRLSTYPTELMSHFQSFQYLLNKAKQLKDVSPDCGMAFYRFDLDSQSIKTGLLQQNDCLVHKSSLW